MGNPQPPAPAPAQPSTAPAMVPVEELEAAVAELPAKMDALREAFDRLAGCSPHPLPFTWEDLDAHVSSIQSSISRRLRQLRVLEAARPTQTRNIKEELVQELEEEVEEEEEEVEEVEVEVEEEEEEEVEDAEEEEDEDDNEEEEVEEEEEEEEEDEEQEEEVVDEDDDKEMGDEEIEETSKEEEGRDEVEGEADKRMPDADNKIGNRAKDKQEANEDEQQDANEELMSVKVSAEQNNEPEEEEQQVEDSEDVQEDEEKEQNTEEEEMFKEMTKRRPKLTPIVWKGLQRACASMDAGMLVKFVLCNSIARKKEFPYPMRYAPDPPALALQVVKLFLSSNKFKSSKAWGKCIELIRWLSMESAKPSADIMEQAKVVAKDWKEMINKLECCGELDLPAWGLLHFLISYNIVSEFDIHEIIRIFAMISRKRQKKKINTMELCNGIGLTNRITDLIDYLIGNGQHLDVFHLANIFNLEDKYHPLSLLKGYIEKAKQTAMEIFRNSLKHKSLGLAISKEINNLWFAHHLAKQKMTHCWERNALMAEIQKLLGQYAENRRIANSASTWNSHQPKTQNQKSKKRKKEEQECHEEQESQRWQEHSQNSLLQAKQHQLQQQENKPQLAQEPQNKLQEMHQHNKPHEMQQQHVNRPCTLKLPTPAVPVVLNAAQIQHLGHLPHTTMAGVQSYLAQPGWPGALGRPLTPQLVAPQYIGPPFNPFSPHPSFYPR